MGSRYQLPVYCLSSPTNLVRENADAEDDDDDEGNGDAKPDGGKSPEDTGVELPLKLRLSSGEDVSKEILQVCFLCKEVSKLESSTVFHTEHLASDWSD